MYKHKNMEKRQRFSIRKLTVGTCSVIIGAFFFGTLQPVSATEVAGTEVVATATENAPNHEAVQNTEEKSGEAVSEVTATDTRTSKNSSEEKPVTQASAKEGTEATSQGGTGEVTNKEEKATEAAATEHVETGKTETGAKAEEANQGQGLDKSKSAPGGQEGPQVGEIKEREESTPTADKTAAKSTQGTLEALLANLTLDSMKALHAEVEEGLAKAKAVLENPKATQEQVDEQVRAMEELTRRVNQALEPSLPKLTDLGEAGSTNNKLVEPNGTATEQATGGKRRKRGGLTDLEPAANQVSPSDGGKEAAPEANSQSTPQELPTYTNTTEGENGVYGLKKELEDITKELRRYGASEDKIQAAKAAADKFNEAFSKGHTINQEDFDAALVDLKKSRALIEGVLESKYGEDATTRRVNIEPRDGGEELPSRGRGRRVSRSIEQGSDIYENHIESYFEDGKKGPSPYDKYTYVFYSRRVKGTLDYTNRPVKDAKGYIRANVIVTERGLKWDIYINDAHKELTGSSVWFTLPRGQNYINNTISISKIAPNGLGSTYSVNPDTILDNLKNPRLGFSRVHLGTPERTGVIAGGSALANGIQTGSLDGLARRKGRGTNNDPYRRQKESSVEQNNSNTKFNQIVKDSDKLYYFELGRGTDKYHISFETSGNRNLSKTSYAVGIRGIENVTLDNYFLVNQWHSRTYNEAKEGAKDDIEQAKNDADQAVDRNNNLSETEKKAAKAAIKSKADEATRQIDQAQDQGGVDTAKNNGVTAINGLKDGQVGRELAKNAVTQAKNDADQAVDRNNNLSETEKKAAKAAIKSKADEATRQIDQAQDQGGVDTAKNNGVTAINGLKDGQVGRELAKNAVTQAKNDADQAVDRNNKLSATEKTAAKAAIKSKADDAISKIGQAQDQNGVDSAKQDGLSALDKILKDLADRINQGNSSTPGNATNQAGSDSRGDAASQGDRPAPSDHGSQGDTNNQNQPTTPSAPAHSGDSTGQATDPSAQQRGTGNATAPESPQGLSESSAKPVVRSRRSVGFAGGTQSSQEKQVDKSVLRDLIQDLETRLKDLDGIDQSVIDAAKVILGEGQTALRNTDLTEAGLREITAKVKEALESLKGKQATKDEEET